MVNRMIKSYLAGVIPAKKLLLDLLEANGSVRAVSLAICLRYDDHSIKDLLSIDVDSFLEPEPLAKTAQAIAFFKKSTYLSIYDQTELSVKAVTALQELESVNRKTNAMLLDRKNFRRVSLIEVAKRIISNILGKVPSVRDFEPMYGPGATFSLPANDSHIAGKLENKFDVTARALPYFLELIGANPRLADANYRKGVEIVPGARFTSVPKQWDKRRPICVEPLGNMMLQKNIGAILRRKLRKVGIDIETQQQFHHHIVKEWWDCFATIDQSDASDRLTVGLAKNLLPYEWYHLLDACRSHRTILPSGEILENERFASQGNGFIFELETLFFYAIAKASIDLAVDFQVEHLVSAFGDDLIIPVVFFQRVCYDLESVGFSINRQKSYGGSSLFRESCGMDTFSGVPVRPLYLKEFNRGLQGLYEAANYVARCSFRSYCGMGFDRVYLRAWLRVLSFIPESHRFGGPEGLGDSVLFGYKSKRYLRDGITYIRCLVPRRRQRDLIKPRLAEPLLTYALLGFPSQGVLLRGRGGVKAGSVCYQSSQTTEYLLT